MSKAPFLKAHLSQALNWIQNSSISPMCFCIQLFLFLFFFFFWSHGWEPLHLLISISLNSDTRHPESICTVVLYFTVLLPPWHGSFTQLTKKKPSSFNVANLNSINTMSTATAQKCPTQNIPLTDISMCMCVCVLGVGGWVWCPGKCEFS